ncbi:MAG: hypothetical protein Q4C96_10215 [Planctomycetia bacterium]|nr:hypothetical protein [Planctomycetia bacterium]
MFKEKWSLPAMLGLSALSFIIPIVGWIVGGLNLKYPARNNQAWLLIGLGVLSFILALIFRYAIPTV